MLDATENIQVEPSAAAGLPGIAVVQDQEYLDRLGLGAEQMANAIHIAWVTGGSMVPPEEMGKYVARGQALL